MKNQWAARFSKDLSKETNDFNSSITTDFVMYKEDIEGSIAHARMLGAQGIIDAKDSEDIIIGLQTICKDIESGILQIDTNAEDIHMFVESELTKRLGELGKKLHTARSRNDQVALDIRLYSRKKVEAIIGEIKSLLSTLTLLAQQHTDTIMPSYTHLQRAQPTTLAHYLMAYASMFVRDIDRLTDCQKRLNISPLGSCALAGTTYPIDRFLVANLLGMDGVSHNSMDGVSDRDFAIELAACISLIMMHLSRFSEEIILWCSLEFGFMELDDAYSTGSSIMPQKKNPDIAELVRGKTGRTYGNLIALLTVMKALPLAYNKDMQEDKDSLFDSIETVLQCLPIFNKMLSSATFNTVSMAKAAEKGFINATDCADYLTKKGVPFRDAYTVVGKLVSYCIANNLTLNNLTLDKYKQFSKVFERDIYHAISLQTCIQSRNSYGSVSDNCIKEQIAQIQKVL